MKLVETRYDEERGTKYFTIEEINNWDLRSLYNLLKAEMSRAKIVSGWYRGSEDLLDTLAEYFNKIDSLP